MSRNQVANRAAVLRTIFIIISTFFITVLATNYKKFLVWNQIVDHYKEDLLTVSEKYYCEAREELNARSVVNVLKVGRLENNYPVVDCKALLAYEAQHENRIDKSCQQIAAGSLNNTCLSHLVRVKILSPVINLAIFLNVSIHTVFTIFCIFVVFLIAALLSTRYTTFNSQRFYFYSSFLMIVSLFMNGRNLLSYLSLGLLLYTMTFESLHERRAKFQFVLALFFAFLFSNVSSGVNLYIWIFFVIWGLCNLKLFQTLNWAQRSVVLVIIVLQSFWVFAGVSKNFIYYGGNVLTAPRLMLNHGLGQYIFSIYGALAFAVLFVLFFFTKNKFDKKFFSIRFFTTPFFLGLSLCFLTGLFGYSILSMSLIYFMIAIGSFVERI